ncbi:MAG: hypothetical protein GY757_18960 [bacterium]|nr:hypothetical protein [bacterium]
MEKLYGVFSRQKMLRYGMSTYTVPGNKFALVTYVSENKGCPESGWFDNEDRGQVEVCVMSHPPPVTGWWYREWINRHYMTEDVLCRYPVIRRAKARFEED